MHDEGEVGVGHGCGPDVDRYVAAIDEFVEAGFDHVYLHQVGPDQKGFIEAFAKDVLPRVRSATSASKR